MKKYVQQMFVGRWLWVTLPGTKVMRRAHYDGWANGLPPDLGLRKMRMRRTRRGDRGDGDPDGLTEKMKWAKKDATRADRRTKDREHMLLMLVIIAKFIPRLSPQVLPSPPKFAQASDLAWDLSRWLHSTDLRRFVVIKNAFHLLRGNYSNWS